MTRVVRLVCASLDLLDAEDQSVDALCARLGVLPPSVWPPEFNGPETRAYFRKHLTEDPAQAPWWAWYLVAKEGGTDLLVGTCGFKGPPTETGEVEIGYSVSSPHQRRGYASGAVLHLIERAFADSRVRLVAAETLPSLVASQGVLLKCGFTWMSERLDPETGVIWRYELSRNRIGIRAGE